MHPVNNSNTWGPKIANLPDDPNYGGNVANQYTNNGADLHPGQYYNPTYAKAGLDGWVTPETYDNVGDYFNTGLNAANMDWYSMGHLQEPHPHGIHLQLLGCQGPDIRCAGGWLYGLSVSAHQCRPHDGEDPRVVAERLADSDQGLGLLDDEGMPQGTASSENLGECTPDFTMGFNLRARWKDLTLSATLDWQKGGKMYCGTLLTMNYFGATEESVDWHEGTFVPTGIKESTGEVWTDDIPSLCAVTQNTYSGSAAFRQRFPNLLCEHLFCQKRHFSNWLTFSSNCWG